MNAAIGTRLQALRSEHPEWRPWLSVVDEILAAAADRRWEEFVPATPRRADRVPLLAQASIVLPRDFLQNWLKQLLRTAAAAGTPAMATLKSASKADIESVELFNAALNQDARQLQNIAVNLGADAKAFESVAQLMPSPFLHACNRLWTCPDEESWTEAYCPLCGAWPALAEVRGIERARYLRCGRCGRQWQAHALRCLFCNNDDHEQLESLVPENNESDTRRIEACKRCFGYVKSITTLQGGDALGVILDDLASIDLDIAAVDKGYRRPEGPGHSLHTTIGYAKSAGNRIFAWGR